MKPRSSSTPALSSPQFAVLGRRPTQAATQDFLVDDFLGILFAFKEQP